MISPLKLLVIEDVPADFMLMERHLRQHGLEAECRRVGSDKELDAALQSEWDLVLSDYNVPGMDFRTTLQRIQAHRTSLPVILVSGSVGEETAVELLHLGMTDFILKDHFARLPSAIRRALEEAEEHRARQAAETELRKLAQAVEQSPESIAILDLHANIEYVNESFVRNTGYSREELIGKNQCILQSGNTSQDVYDELWKDLKEAKTWKGEFYSQRKDGSEYIERAIISPIRQSDGCIKHYVAIREDITEKKRAEAEIHRLAFYDTLTGLPNRALLLDRLRQALASSTRSGRQGALLSIDLDDFKTLNDTLGYDFGDVLLQQVAQRLISCAREGDTVARLGGDEFVVVLEGLSNESIEAAEQTESVGLKILSSLNQPYQIAMHTYHSTVSIGATLFNDRQHTMDDLMKQVDIAIHQAKKADRNTLRFFDPKMQDIINAHAAIEKELRKAIENQQLQLYYQIQVDSLHRQVGAEALIRWIHPERGLVSPSQFIPLAEETGLILSIGQWVLEAACTQLKAWQQDTLTNDLILSVNVSAKQFRQTDFAVQVQTVVKHHAINPELLKLELTESMLVDNIENIISTMSALKEIGVQFSLDDFGTGYSSLQYLKRLPLDQLKIDQSFVRDLASDISDRAIIRTIIAMAQSLNLDVIAEGVETADQRQLLLDSGCMHYQGYLFGKPMPIEQFGALLKQR